MKKVISFFTALLTIAGIGTILSSCDKPKDIEGEHRTYFAIQKEWKGPWSIIDKDGKIVVDDAYPCDVAISEVYDGAYWVMYFDYNYKCVLHSVDSPDKPLCDTCLAVTDFATGRAIVSMKGKPLQIIDTKGKVVATLPESYTKVSAFNSDGVARYESRFTHLTGTLNRDGDELYEDSHNKILPNSLGDGAMILSNGDIVNYDGEKLGYIDINKYKIDYADKVRFSDGLLALVKYEDHSIAYIDKKGNEQFTNKLGPAFFHDGYAVSNYTTVFDKQGNTVMETDNTYRGIYYLAEGKFLKEEDEYCSLVDAQGKELSRFDDIKRIGKLTLLGKDRFVIDNRIYDMQGKFIKEVDWYHSSISPLSVSPCKEELSNVDY